MLFVIKQKSDKEKVIGYLKRLPETPLGYKLQIEKIRNVRSVNQNNYYWGVVIKMLGDEIGYSPEEMHNALQIKFLSTHLDKLPSVKSTKKLSTKEFEEHLSKIRQWASEQGTFLPLPNEICNYDSSWTAKGGG